MPFNERHRVRQPKETIMSMSKTTSALVDKLAGRGILAMYGGGNKSNGHGFWLYATTPEKARATIAADFYCAIPGKCLENDGRGSGNPSFWMFKEAAALAKRAETRMFRIENRLVDIDAMLTDNAHDPDTCAWLQSCEVGAKFNECERVR
jgi:hypothetical protein